MTNIVLWRCPKCEFEQDIGNNWMDYKEIICKYCNHKKSTKDLFQDKHGKKYGGTD